MAITAASASTIAAYVAAATAVAGAVTQGVTNYEAAEAKRAEYKYNQRVEENSQKQAYQEESLNSTQHYRKVRHDIAAGQNAMAAFGNIGTSAESAMYGAYFNLAEDLSAIRYRYGAEATGHANAALNYKHNASVAKRNRDMGVLASSINTAGAIAGGVSDLYSKGHLGSKTPKTSRTTYSGGVDKTGMYGSWVG